MKAIYRGPTVALIPETDMESDFLAQQFNTKIYKMSPLQVGGISTTCFEFVIVKISDDAGTDSHATN